MSAESARSTREWRWNVVVAAVATVCAAGVLELGARIVVPPAIVRLAMFRPAADVAYELLPGYVGRGPLGEAVRVNAAGRRGGSESAAKAGRSRVLVVGDSFVFGLGVAEDESFPAALARALTRLGESGADRRIQAGGSVEVLNAGVPGYNLMQEARFIATRSAGVAADAIVLGFVENDLYNLDGSDLVAAQDGTLRPRPGAFQPATTVNPFAALSGPLLWLQLHSAAVRAASFLGIELRLRVRGDAELTEWAARTEAADELPARLLRGDEDAETAPRWAAAARALAAAGHAAQVQHATPLLLLFPRPEQLYSARLRQGFARIAAIAEREGFRVVDPSPRLAAEPDRIGLYLFPRDHHPSGRGYALIADEVARALTASD